MNRKASCLVAVAVLVLLVGPLAAFAAKPLTPELGFYESVAPPPEGGDVSTPDTIIRVVQVGSHRGVEFDVYVKTNCTDSSGRTSSQYYHWLEKKPTLIKGSKFAFKRTKHQTVAGGSGSGNTTFQISGTFKSATKVVGRKSVNGSYDFPEVPSVGKLTCVGNVGFTAEHK